MILVQKKWNSPPSLSHGNPTSVVLTLQTIKKEFGDKPCYLHFSSWSGSMKSWLDNLMPGGVWAVVGCLYCHHSKLSRYLEFHREIPYQISDCTCMKNGLRCPETSKAQIWTNQKLIVGRRMMYSIISTEIPKRRIIILEILEPVVSSKRLTANLTCFHERKTWTYFPNILKNIFASISLIAVGILVW